MLLKVMKKQISLQSHISLVVFLAILFQINAQISDRNDVDQNATNSRFYFDGGLFGAYESGKFTDHDGVEKHYLIGVFGIQTKFGNDFILNSINENFYFRLNWIRLGIYVGDGSGLTFSPLHLGLGYRLKTPSGFSFEPKITGGLYVGTDDIIHPDIEFDYAIVPAITFLFPKGFSIEIEWTPRRNFLGYSGQFNYFGLLFGKTINK